MSRFHPSSRDCYVTPKAAANIVQDSKAVEFGVLLARIARSVGKKRRAMADLQAQTNSGVA
jgi:hypothetical protein